MPIHVVGGVVRLAGRLHHGRVLLDERRAHAVRPRCNPHPHVQVIVDADVRVVRGVPPHQPVLARVRREDVEPHAVERDLHVVRFRQTLDVLVPVPLQANPNLVLAVGREHVLHERSAARPERQAVDMPFLRPVGRDNHHAAAGRRQPAPHGQLAHLLRGGEIAFHQRRRQGAGVHVVEPERDVVARQEGRHIDVEIEQVTDSVLVLGPAEPAERRRASRVGRRSRRLIQRRLEIADQAGVAGGARPRARLGRHGAGAQLAEHRLPERRIRLGMGDIHPFQRQIAGLQAVVVARDTVTVQKSALRFRFLVRPLGEGGTGRDRAEQHKRQSARRERPQTPRDHVLAPGLEPGIRPISFASFYMRRYPAANGPVLR